MLKFDAQRIDETPQANDYHTPGFDTERGSMKGCFGECTQHDSDNWDRHLKVNS